MFLVCYRLVLVASVFLMFSIDAFARTNRDVQRDPSKRRWVCSRNAKEEKEPNFCLNPHEWSFEVGGQYTWMSFTTPPSFRGSSGGVQGKITYQEPNSFFGQLRSIYNVGPLSNGKKRSGDDEWYSEFVSGYCFCAYPRFTITPYAGIGLDFLNDHKDAYSIFPAINLYYRSYYALFGFDTRYSWRCWYLGLQADCIPVFHQYLRISTMAGTCSMLDQRVGVAVRLPAGYKLAKHVWMELMPYYRLLPLGKSTVIGTQERTLNQWGVFLTFRFFKEDP